MRTLPLGMASSPRFLNKIKPSGHLSHSNENGSSTRHSRNTHSFPRPTVSNPWGPAGVISAAHSVVNENWKLIQLEQSIITLMM